MKNYYFTGQAFYQTTVYGYLILKQSRKGLRKIKQSQRVEIPYLKKIPVKNNYISRYELVTERTFHITFQL